MSFSFQCVWVAMLAANIRGPQNFCYELLNSGMISVADECF